MCHQENLTLIQCHARTPEFYGDSTIGCKCGDIPKTIRINKEFLFAKSYCCSPTPCERNGNTIICKNGTLNYFKEQCEAQGETNINQCPTANVVSSSAISINKIGSQFQCYEEAKENVEFNKVYLNHDNVTDQDFARIFCGSGKGIICNSTYSHGKYSFQQCYNNDFFHESR